MRKKVFLIVLSLSALILGGCTLPLADETTESGAAADEIADSRRMGNCPGGPGGGTGSLSQVEQLGRQLFFDMTLSAGRCMSCASCHAPATGFTGPKSMINSGTAVYPGAVASRFGNRKPPSAAYAGYSPGLSMIDGAWIGGMFWDGRAAGWTLGDPLAEQATGPFLNPLEHNLPDAETLVRAVASRPYAGLFRTVWGEDSLNSGDVEKSFELIGRSIAAYERSDEVNPFSSRYDAVLAGRVRLTGTEAQGLALFQTACAACHAAGGSRPLFTNYGYANVGFPRNPDNPFYDMPAQYNPDGADWVDPGLGGFLGHQDEYGKHKVPTLRNVDKRPGYRFVKAYGHNGYFKSLEETVHFLNTRDVPGAGWNGIPWPAPEVAVNITTGVGNLGLSSAQEAALVAFLKTLSDGYFQP